MKKLSDTYKELGIAFTFPIVIKDSDNNKTYCEHSGGYWAKWEYDSDGNVTYYENSDYWCKYEYDANGKKTYFEDSDSRKNGTPRSQSCAGKVIDVDGKKYILIEL